MSYKTFSIRMDADIKQRFDEFCENVGMNPSTAINLFARAVVKERRIPFEISDDPFYSESNQIALRESIKQLNEGKVVYKTMEELEQMANE